MSLKTYLRNPRLLVLKVGRKTFLRLVSDEKYLKFAYKTRMGKSLNLEDPKTFTEKLQWLKLHNRKPEYTRMVDKYEAKEYVAEKLGAQHIIPTLGIWDRFEDIDFDSLPDQFVLKCTHDSGGLVICRDKSTLDKETAKKKISRCLKRNYYYQGREWPYKNVKPRILAESYMEEEGSNTLTDYKVFCFNGEPKTVLTVVGGHGNESVIKRRMYDTDWNLLPIGLHGKPFVNEPQEKPEQLTEILQLAKVLCANIPHVRVDFYVIGGKVYFGEITFFHMSGLVQLDPPQWDETFGSWIQL